MTTQDNPEAFPDLSKGEILAARKEGIEDAVRETTAQAFKAGANEAYDGDTGDQRFTGARDVMRLEPLLGYSEEALLKEIDGTNERPITEAQIAGLLEMERSGKNRTEYVKVLMKRLGVKSPYEVTNAGPAYTNDTTNVTKIV